MQALLMRLSRAEPHEAKAALWSFVYFFGLLASYYVLRPLRDEMAIQLGSGAINELFSAVFLTMLALVPMFGWLTKKFERQQLLPWLYAFFVGLVDAGRLGGARFSATAGPGTS